MIRGTTTLIAHLGYPTASFKAPMIYNPYFDHIGVNARVMPMGCKPDDYPAFLRAWNNLGVLYYSTDRFACAPKATTTA